jgi:hypothetical protein
MSMRTICLAMDLTIGRPVCCYRLDEPAFAATIRWILEGVAEGSIIYADCATADGRFRIRRR